VPENEEAAIDKQYELLNILDSKASALLTFNAIALASISIWLGYVPLNFLHLSLDLVFVVLLLSCAGLLRIIWLRWASTRENVEALDRIRQARTGHYRLAWILSFGSIICLIAISLVHLTGTLLIATDNCQSRCQVFYSEKVFGNLDYHP